MVHAPKLAQPPANCKPASRRVKILLNLFRVSGVLLRVRRPTKPIELNKMTMIPTKLTLAALAAAFSFALAASAELPPAATKTGVTYATDMKPLFDASCVKCHSGDKPKARLKMDTLEGVLKGTKMGPILKAGDSANSFIVQAVAHTTKDKDTWMPPMPNKAGIKTLTPEQIGLIRAWIDQGAK
jgi:mono/diheme cytochrome c family protein